MTQVTQPALGVYDSAGLERGPGTYISNQLSWDAAAADPNETRGLRLPFCRLSVEGGAERKAHCWRGAGMQSTAHTRLGQFRAFPLEWQVGASISLGGHGGKDPPHSRGSTKLFFLQNQKQ